MLRLRHQLAVLFGCVVAMGVAGQAFAANPGVQLNYDAAKWLGKVAVGTGWIDVTNGALITASSDFGFIPSGNYATYGAMGVAETGSVAVRDAVLEGFAPGVSRWTGQTGVNSSFAAADPAGNFMVGSVDETYVNYPGFRNISDLSTIPGYPNLIITSACLQGDTNLDGIVDSSDLNNVLQGETGATVDGTGQPKWQDGDTNYDGIVDSSDLNNVLAAENAGAVSPFGPSSPISGSLSSSVAAGSVVGVPEPSSLLLLSAFAVAFSVAMFRRRVRP